MLYWSLMFFVFALVAAVLGFGGVAGAAANIAQVLFFFFVVALIITMVMNIAQGRRPPV